MVARLIEWCVSNRVMVLLLSLVLVAAGIWSIRHITIDAIPDLSDVQVVMRAEFPGQAPQVVEDQVTYPLTTAMLAVPQAKVVRGYSMFGTSFVYVIFDDGTDMYWARSRVLEQLNAVGARLPEGVTPQLGPDATGVGWVYQYVLTTGRYCDDHRDGLWHHAASESWFERPADAPDSTSRDQLSFHRTFAEFDIDYCPIDGSGLQPAQQDLSDLRGLQDWYLRYELTAVEGVSEVAPVGGYVKQYQVVVDPVKLLAYDISLQQISTAIRRSNMDVGGRLIEQSETEYMVRGLGYLGSVSPDEARDAREQGVSIEQLRTDRAIEELKQIALRTNEQGLPIYVGDVAEVRIGPEIRRGIAEWNGEGEVVGGIVIMRSGENAQATIKRVRERLNELEKGLPPGVAIEVAYDRSDLIERAVKTVSDTLVEEIVVVSLMIVLFLLHARSALVAAVVLPLGVLMTLTTMYGLDINANIMSLGGIAISIGVMVDSSIVMVENAHKHLEQFTDKHSREPSPAERVGVIRDAAVEVGPTLFFSLLIITISFLPIFVLGEQSGRLFKPLAFTKTFAMAAAAIIAVTIIPVLMVYLVRNRTLPSAWSRTWRYTTYAAVILLPALLLWWIPLAKLNDYRWALVVAWFVLAVIVLLPQRVFAESRNPVSYVLQKVYQPLFVFVMQFRWLTIIASIVLMCATLHPLSQLGSEFMPPLQEGDLLYMPTTTQPGLSMTKAREILQQTDKLIAQFPEVKNVFGKIGRAETATDPAPLNMIETTILLHRDKSRWRTRDVPRFYDAWPDWLAWLPAKVWPSNRPITTDELVYGYDMPNGDGEPVRVPGMHDVVNFPGLPNSWTMPIRTRIDMLATGIRTPVGIKVMGSDLRTLAELSQQLETIMKTDPTLAPYTTSATADRNLGGNYFDFKIDREAIARYGLTVGDVQDVITSALGGRNVTSTVEGLERYPVNVRYPHELRDNIESLRQTLVATPSGAHVPIGQLASIDVHKGPPMIKSENARPTSWVFVDIAGIDVGTYVDNAKRVVEQRVQTGEIVLPDGYNIIWSGQYEYMQAARNRLMVVVPLTGVLILLLLYLATRSWLRVAILILSLPFSLVGAIWLLYWLDYDLSLAVWVGVIALAGLAVETGLVMLLYLDNSFERFEADGKMNTPADLWHAIHDGAVQRIRPKTMTVMTTFIGLVPLLWASGAGADTMRRLAAPMIGGLATAFVLELLLYPVLYYIAKRIALRSRFKSNASG